VLSPVAELCILKGVLSLSGHDLELAISVGYYLEDCLLLLLAVSPIFWSCVFLLVGRVAHSQGMCVLLCAAWEARGRFFLVDFYFLVVPCMQRGISPSWGC
jgi:hypothetical protein